MKIAILTLLLLVIPLQHVCAEVELKDSKVTLDKVEINQYSLDFTGDLFIDEKKLSVLIDMLEEKIYKAPVNASIGENGKIIEEKPGVTIDSDHFQVLFREAFYDDAIKKLEVPKKAVYPRIDTALINEIHRKELGSFVTHFKETNVERSHNIGLAADAINSHVVFPGEVFSFNDVVGERTKEKGYKRAPVIVRGELADDIGGGICQVSSTLFNAVDLKGIQIMERYAHSRSVPYVPLGRDATVSWWGPDFVFKNMYNQPILIRAHSKNGKMIVRIFSSEDVDFFSGK